MPKVEIEGVIMKTTPESRKMLRAELELMRPIEAESVHAINVHGLRRYGFGMVRNRRRAGNEY